MRLTMRFLVVALALTLGATAAQAAGQAPQAKMKIKVLGFAAIYPNDDHLVQVKNKGVLRRCDNPRALSVVLSIANLEGGIRYQARWTRKGKLVVKPDKGKTGTFDAKPTRVKFALLKGKHDLVDGTYVFRLKIGSKVVATGKVKRACD